MTIPGNFLSAIATAGGGQTTATWWDRVVAFLATNSVVFWSVVGVAAVIIIALIIFLALRSKRKKQEAPADSSHTPVTFLPIEEETAEIEAEYLTMQDKLIAAEDELDLKLLEQIKNKGPQALADIVAAYDKCQAAIQEQLQTLVKEERLMERYSRRLNREEYPQSVLLEAWARFPDDAALKDFVEMLASNDESIQLAGTRLLSAMQEPKSLPLLTAALMWPEHFLPARVAEVMASMGPQSAKLLAYLLPKVNDKHKVRVLETIAKTESSYPIANVAACLAHTNPAVRVAAATALGTSKNVDSIKPLLISATDKDWHVRAAVAKSLGMIGDQRAISALEVLARDAEGWVAVSAQQSLSVFAETGVIELPEKNLAK